MGTNYFASQQKKEKIHSLFLQTAVNASTPRGVERPSGWTEPCLKDARKPLCRGYSNMILSPSILYVGFYLFIYLFNKHFTHMSKITITDAKKLLSLWPCTKISQLAMQRELTGCSIFQPYRKKLSAILLDKFRPFLAWSVTDTTLVRALCFIWVYVLREEKKKAL